MLNKGEVLQTFKEFINMVEGKSKRKSFDFKTKEWKSNPKKN
jgi:hypothetical protein